MAPPWPIGEHPAHRLTPCQRDVLQLIANGKRNGAIAAELFIAAATVQDRVDKTLRILGARNRTQAVAIAIRAGVIT